MDRHAVADALTEPRRAARRADSASREGVRQASARFGAEAISHESDSTDFLDDRSRILRLRNSEWTRAARPSVAPAMRRARSALVPRIALSPLRSCRSSSEAAEISERWVKACGKFPRKLPDG